MLRSLRLRMTAQKMSKQCEAKRGLEALLALSGACTVEACDQWDNRLRDPLCQATDL